MDAPEWMTVLGPLGWAPILLAAAALLLGVVPWNGRSLGDERLRWGLGQLLMAAAFLTIGLYGLSEDRGRAADDVRWQLREAPPPVAARVQDRLRREGMPYDRLVTIFIAGLFVGTGVGQLAIGRRLRAEARPETADGEGRSA